MKETYKPEAGNDKLQIIKNADKIYAVKDDVITYTIEVTNIGESKLKNVLIFDILCEQIAFVAGSVKINQVAKVESSILAGVPVGTLEVGSKKIVTFQAKVVQSESEWIENIAGCQFNEVTDGGIEEEYEVASNMHKIALLNPCLSVSKKGKPEFVVRGDRIEYEIEISNTGNLNVYNVYLKDTLPKAVKFIPESFKINQRVVNGVELAKGIRIGEIAEGEAIKIFYQGEIQNIKQGTIQMSEPEVSFRYRLEDGTSGTKIAGILEEEMALEKINIGLMTFKEISVEKYLTLADTSKTLGSINHIAGEVKITKQYLIKSQKGVSIEGKKMTGKQMGIMGYLELIVEYISIEEMIHTATYSIPFSSYVMLPEDYHEGNRVEVIGQIEDTYGKVINPQNFFVVVGILINMQRIEG